MSLPKIDMPTFKTDIVSKNKSVEMRPMTVKEQKILLMGQQAATESDILSAIIQIIQSCMVSDINVQDLSMTDLTGLLINLRAQSVSNIVAVTMQDGGRVAIDLDNAITPPKDTRKSKILLSDKMFLHMRDVPAHVFTSKEYVEATTDDDFDENKLWDAMIPGCLLSLEAPGFDKPIDMTTWSNDDVKEWMDSLPADCYDKMKDYINSAPSYSYKDKYKDEKGEEQEINLSTLYDFFLI